MKNSYFHLPDEQLAALVEFAMLRAQLPHSRRLDGRCRPGSGPTA